MKGLCKLALAILVVAACGRDSAITGPDEPTAPPPMSGGILALGVDSTTGASIETNKDDYAPGEVVHLIGRGWASGETVNLHMTEAPNTHADVDTNVVADGAGGFSIHFYDVQEHDLGVTFTLTATGATSHSVAVAVFTDGRAISTATINGFLTVTVAPSASLSANAVGALTGNANNTLGSIAVHSYVDGTLPATAVLLTCYDLEPDQGPSSPSVSIPFNHTFPFTGPASAAVYDVIFTTYADDACAVVPGSSPFTLQNAITVQSPNTAPTLTGVPTTAQSIPELVLYTFDAEATDPGAPPQTLTFSIVGGSLPTGANFVTATGVFTWTPTEAQGPSGPHTFTVRVSDGTANTDQLVSLNVTEVNAAPVLQNVPASATIAEEAPYTFDANATDSDFPVQTLTFSLQGQPAGAAINSTSGIFTWTPTEAQGPDSYTFDVRVFDGVVHTTQSITLTVSEANASPTLTDVPSAPSIPELVNYTFDADAADTDVPLQTLTFSLIGAPAGASIHPTTGVFSWTPTEAQGPDSYPFTVRVSDGLANTDQPITITVTEVNVAPVLNAIGNKIANELSLISFTATASDADLPANTLTFTLGAGAPAGAAIGSGGSFTWTPTEAQGPGDYPVTVRVTDNGTGNLWDEETITIHVNEVNAAPVLAGIGNKSGDELTAITFDANATDSDLPANGLTFSLDAGAPAGATINPTSGAFSWMPSEADGPGNFSVTVRVTDDGSPTLSDFETINIHVNEVNVAPVLDEIGAKSVDEGSLLTFDANATDADLPANTLTYSLDAGAPAGASINSTTGVFTWTPTNGPSQSTSITVRVTDNGTPALNDFETINVTVNNVVPIIGTITAPLAPVAVGTNNVTVTWNFTDPGADTWTCSIEWDTGAGFTSAGYVATKSCNATASLTPGLYTVRVKVDDGDGGIDIDPVTAYIVVYDPTGGFVTGGGWIMSPAGAYADDLTLTGKANFGFVSKYQQGKTLPQGNTEFQFHAGNLNFKSTVYEWLVVAGTRAQFKGDGTINGVGGYGFLLTGIDDGSGNTAQDKFRIKIVNKTTGVVVYDNQPGYGDDSPAATVIGGGSIVVHTKK